MCTLNRKFNRKLAVGFGIFAALLLFIFLTQAVSQKNPNDINLMQIETPPSQEHPLGTDSLGRDILVRKHWR